MELSPEEKEALLKKRREYQREWRKRNPQKAAANAAKYWAQKAVEYAKENK